MFALNIARSNSEITNVWADAIRTRLLALAEMPKNTDVWTRGLPDSHEAHGRVIVGAHRYQLSFEVKDRDDYVAVRVEGKMNFAHRRRAAFRHLTGLGYRVERDGDAIVTRVEACRRDIIELIDVLAAA